MNNLEEKLWNYIDGNCTPDEYQAISAQIASNEVYNYKYQELLSLNSEFSAMDLDEPAMAFTYNVIEAIRTEEAKKPLKAAVNKRIIISIAVFFTLTILALLAYTFANIDWAGQRVPTLTTDYKLPEIKSFITKPVIQGFFFFDTILALFLFDAYLRRKKTENHV
jgi:hypothetical protein